MSVKYYVKEHKKILKRQGIPLGLFFCKNCAKMKPRYSLGLCRDCFDKNKADAKAKEKELMENNYRIIRGVTSEEARRKYFK